MPPRMQASITLQLSVANFIGGTTKQLELETNGRARHLSSPPAIMCSNSKAGGTCVEFEERGADMLGGAGAAGVDRVEVHLEIVGDVAAHHRPLVEMDVVEFFDDARGVIKVLRRRFAVLVLLYIDDVDRRAGGAVVHPRTGQLQIAFRVAGEKRDIARRFRQHVLDEGAGEADAAVVALDRAGAGQDFNAGGRCVGKADRLQRLERRLMDALAAIFGQRLVPATAQPGANRADVVGKRRGAGGVARQTSAGSPRPGRNGFTHFPPPEGALRLHATARRIVERTQRGSRRHARSGDFDFIFRCKYLFSALASARHVAHADRPAKEMAVVARGELPDDLPVAHDRLVVEEQRLGVAQPELHQPAIESGVALASVRHRGR